MFVMYPLVAALLAAYAYHDFSVKTERKAIAKREELVATTAASLRDAPIEQWRPSESICIVEFAFNESSTDVWQSPVNGVPRELLLAAAIKSPVPVTVGQQSAVCLLKFDGQRSRKFIIATKKGG